MSQAQLQPKATEQPTMSQAQFAAENICQMAQPCCPNDHFQIRQYIGLPRAEAGDTGDSRRPAAADSEVAAKDQVAMNSQRDDHVAAICLKQKPGQAFD